MQHIEQPLFAHAATRTHPGTLRRLLPREHGVWAQLLLPLLTALALVPWNWASAALSVAAVAVFLAHEPAVVLLGHRGQRAFDELEEDAWRLLVLLGIVAGCVGGIATATASVEATLALALPLSLGTGAVWFVIRKKEKSIAGEIWIAAALASCAFPVAVAGDASFDVAIAVAEFWALIFVMCTLAVRVVIGQTRRESTGTLRGLIVACAILLWALAEPLTSGAHWLSPATAMFVVSGVCLVVALRPPHSRELRRIGWVLAAACSVTFVLLSWSLG